MNPKSYKVFKEGIAEKVGVHPSVVDEFVNFYYETTTYYSTIHWRLGCSGYRRRGYEVGAGICHGH